MVRKLAKPGHEILSSMSPADAALWHMATGICTEAGELLSTVKSAVMYRRPLDIPNLVEEIGDLEFYIQGLLDIIDSNRDECLAANMHKLAIRYPGFEYTDSCANKRMDKKEGE